MGTGYLLSDRYDAALPFFEAVISMTDLSSLMVYAVALRNAGVCYARLGDFDRAIAVQRSSSRSTSNAVRASTWNRRWAFSAPRTCSTVRIVRRSRTCDARSGRGNPGRTVRGRSAMGRQSHDRSCLAGTVGRGRAHERGGQAPQREEPAHVRSSTTRFTGRRSRQDADRRSKRGHCTKRC